MQKFCTTDWLGQPVSEMQKVVPQTRFLLESYEAQVQIRSVASASGHRCHVWFDERGVISALEVVFHF